MPVVSAAESQSFEIPGAQFIGLAAPSRGATENAVWRVTIAPGTPALPHRLTREEIFVALAGRAKAIIGGVAHDIAAGGAIIVPAHTDFTLANPHDRPFEAVVVLPVGGQAVIGDGPPFTPPWAE